MKIRTTDRMLPPTNRLVLHFLISFILYPTAFPADGPETTPSIEGIWRWTFTMPDGSQVNPRLEIRQEDGQWTGTARFRIGTDAPITNLTFQGSEVNFEVLRERDGQVAITRYSGLLSSNVIKGKVVSNWAGDEQSYDWEAHRSMGPTGTWKWASRFGTNRIESKLTLKVEGEKADKLSGHLSWTGGGEADIKHGRVKANEISFVTERERDGVTYTNHFYGRVSPNRIRGKIELDLFGSLRTNLWEAIRID